MRNTLRRLRRCERGDGAIGFVLAVPAFLLFIGLVIMAGRLAMAESAVESAAAEAARAASLARNASAAQAQAADAADSTLTNSSLRCSSTSVSVDTGDFSLPLGQAGTVTTRVSCTVPLRGLGLPVNGARTVDATSSSAIDAFRERS